MLKIERDKFYVDGVGNKVRVVCVDNTLNETYPVIGVYNSGQVTFFTSKGKYLSDSDKSTHVHDLVREVKEKKISYLNIYPKNTIFRLYDSKQKADACASVFRIACIRVEYEEGQFDD